MFSHLLPLLACCGLALGMHTLGVAGHEQVDTAGSATTTTPPPRHDGDVNVSAPDTPEGRLLGQGGLLGSLGGGLLGGLLGGLGSPAKRTNINEAGLNRALDSILASAERIRQNNDPNQVAQLERITSAVRAIRRLLSASARAVDFDGLGTATAQALNPVPEINRQLDDIKTFVDNIRQLNPNNAVITELLNILRDVDAARKALTEPGKLGRAADVSDVPKFMTTIGGAISQGCTIGCQGACQLYCPVPVAANPVAAAATGRFLPMLMPGNGLNLNGLNLNGLNGLFNQGLNFVNPLNLFGGLLPTVNVPVVAN